jgi:hypothetical protein
VRSRDRVAMITALSLCACALDPFHLPNELALKIESTEMSNLSEMSNLLKCRIYSTISGYWYGEAYDKVAVQKVRGCLITIFTYSRISYF